MSALFQPAPRRAWLVPFYLFLLCSAPAALAQQSGAPTGVQQQSRRPASPARSNNMDRHLTIDVVVNDKAGKPVPGLKQNDFTILDNKHPQNILSFQEVGVPPTADDPPMQIILLVDAVNTSWEGLGFERLQIAKALGQNGGQLVRPVAIDLFVDPGIIVRNAPSRDGNALIATLAQNETSLRTLHASQGSQAENDLVKLSLDTLKQFAASEMGQPGKKMLIWISPGWPLYTGLNELDSKDQQRLFESIVEFSTLLRQARITLYSVDPLGTANTAGLASTLYRDFLGEVRKASQAEPGDLALQVLAEHSGGLALNSSNDIAGEIQTCLADANAFYELSFNSPPADGPNEYHLIEVKLNTPKSTAHATREYYAQP